jgi:hypothetical protein
MGRTNGTHFLIGRCVFPLKVTFICEDCGHTNQWRPVIPRDG